MPGHVDARVGLSGRDDSTGAPLVRYALVLVGACAVGVFSDRGALLASPWSALAEIGTPFVLVAFAAGRQPPRPGWGMVWGAVALGIGLAAYDAWMFLVQDVPWGTLTHGYRAGAWLAAGVVVGALAGACGAASRPGRGAALRATGWGLLVASPLAEGVRVSRWAPPATAAALLLLVLAAGLYAWAVQRDRTPWQLAAVSVAAFAPALILAETFRHLV